jgi:phosphoglycerate kinase
MAPVDGKFVKPDGSVRIGNVDGMEPDEAMLDHGPETVRQLTALAKEAKTVLWNGPLGEYEKGFVEATDEFAKALIQTGAHSIVGGGDTVAEIERIGLLNHFSFVSIGGGAMLAYLAQGTLPGIEVLG